MLEVLSNNLIYLQDEYPLSTTYQMTEISDLDPLPKRLPGANPQQNLCARVFNRAWIKSRDTMPLPIDCYEPLHKGAIQGRVLA